MRILILAALMVSLAAGLSPPILAASRTHVISFGKWSTIRISTVTNDDKAVEAKIRPLYVDGKQKEFTIGASHDLTERLFVVQRVLHINDALPGETAGGNRWVWQRGGWLLVDRNSGHISVVNLPDFDSENSSVVWYRDYAAYCGLADDGKTLFAVVMQVGRRKPVLHKSLGEISEDGTVPCDLPLWQRLPSRVTFASTANQRFTFAVRGRSAEILSDDDEE